MGSVIVSGGNVSLSLDTATSLTLNGATAAATGGVSGNGKFETTGAVQAGTTVTGGTGVVATTGNVAATAGNVTAGGSVSATTTVTGGTGVIIGTGGTAISKSKRVTFTLDVTQVLSQTSNLQTVVVSGAAVGAEVIVGCATTIEQDLVLTAYVSAADTVKVKILNPSIGDITPAAAQTCSVRVFNP